MSKPIRVALVAGEASGDILGAGLMQQIRQQHDAAVEFVGVGGPLMQAQGLRSSFPMERLAVMGLVEVLGRLPELLRRRRRLVQQLLQDRPDVFVGIDAPDFNLSIELKLREQGIKTVHYVSPSVWAWRQKRVFKIRRACDLMLCLLPFEAGFYQQHQVPVRFVGHPLADSIAMQPDRAGARQRLGIASDVQLVALLPGSRGGEVARLGELFVQSAQLLWQKNPQLTFVLPAASAERRQQLEQIVAGYPQLPLSLLDGQSQDALQACDAVLIASGTATLEAMLFKRPMVVAYRLAGLTHWLLKRMVKSRFFALPNLLAGRELVPEYIQHAATPQALSSALEQALHQPRQQTEAFYQLHQQMRLDASAQSAAAVLQLLGADTERQHAKQS